MSAEATTAAGIVAGALLVLALVVVGVAWAMKAGDKHRFRGEAEPPYEDPPYNGDCAVCGGPVREDYPLWSADPDAGGRPVHAGECTTKLYAVTVRRSDEDDDK